MTKKCKYCGRFFTPDKKTARTQKACHRPECRKARKKEAQLNWKLKNPDYFEDHYERYIKPQRIQKRQLSDCIEKKQGSRMIKDKIPSAKYCKTVVFIIPAKLLIKDRISLRRIGSNTFAAYGS